VLNKARLSDKAKGDPGEPEFPAFHLIMCLIIYDAQRLTTTIRIIFRFVVSTTETVRMALDDARFRGR
jgi:hypothetical protein